MTYFLLFYGHKEKENKPKERDLRMFRNYE